MVMKNKYFIKNSYRWLFLICTVLLGCDLEEVPVDTANKGAVFGSENGLQLYANSFYDWLPSANNIHQADAISDYSARRNAPDFLRAGNVYTSRTTDNTSASGYDMVALGSDWNWGWGTLRNINFFLENNKDPKIAPEVRKHYNGLARFFRAWFYFEKVKRYGEVPWINKPLDVADPQLYGSRDPRTLVMDSVLADINYAIANIRTVNESSRTLITKDVALALKSRIALFEGTFRKYHTDKGLANTATTWLAAATDASETVMNSGRYSLYKGGGTDLSYRQLFISDAPVASEVILAVVSSTALNVRHAANWYFTSATTGTRFSFIRPFINTYLNIDGTPFTDEADYQTQTFMDEVKGRDKRLAQTIRTGSYKRVNAGNQVPAPPAFTYTYTGYQPIKWSVDNVAIDGGNNNTNAVSIFRYAEILLNYAEAKAELGTLTTDDWTKTIGALRSRAGITGGLSALPTVADPYLQSTYFPGISDPVILEVRRERGIELALEGFRFYDIIRWKRGELMEMPWTGIYVPEANKLMDLNEDGTPDVYFYTQAPASQINGVNYINVATESYKLTNGTSGQIVWLPNIVRKWEEKKYFYPVPETHLLTNPKLGQNTGW
ncbi:RagB/SusD family nutrient uptake outer membrane protein [Adhaeribacter rhizoryzae]|uniref:RagB/SusD family nutrient uptake outer membrane protein n=2 Tax=Adhaeribacter rhizoryzae TaxID=2607907 RepID=A0A5M6D9E5_9BACT|nr:RagB/SusD family nutrient uptake outer membrane protein [Adhaeribacter rhizoryzae]